MKRFLPALTFALLALLILIPAQPAHADMGPKPTMDFRLAWSIPRVEVADASLFFCEDATCMDPGEVAGPFSCTQDRCLYNYGGSGWYKLEIVFADQTRVSNVFEKRGFQANFEVAVNPNGLLVKQVSFPFPYLVSAQVAGFFLAALVTLGIEIPLAGLVLKRWGMPRKWKTILAANLVTLPIVWFGFPFIGEGFSSLAVIALAELFAWLVEATFYFFALRKDGLSLGRAVAVSLLANAASVGIPALCLLIPFVTM